MIMIRGGSLSSRGPTRPARRADLSFQGIASVAMRSSVFTPLDNVEEFCPKKLPCAYDTDGPLEHSATAAFDPERPDLARNADAAPLREAFREHISPASIRKKAPATMGQRVSLQEELINMKITSKQMVSASKKCEKNEKKYRKDVKKAGSRRPVV